MGSWMAESQAAIVAGVLPFLIGDAIKIAVAAGVVPSARMLIAGLWDRSP